MKKIFIIIGSILLVVFTSVVIINTTSKTYNFDKITVSFLTQYNKDKVNSVEAYRGEDLYYIVDFEQEQRKYIGVLNKKEKLIYEIAKDDLYNIEAKNKVIGYKNDKLIYEVKKNTKDGFTYYYYDALTGDFIKKITIDK